MRYPCRIPPSLRPGDRVALVSPSYHAPMENVTAAADVLRGWGFEPVLGRHVGKVHAGQYAGTLEQRAEDLRWALTDPSIRAVLCNRGGTATVPGSTRTISISIPSTSILSPLAVPRH